MKNKTKVKTICKDGTIIWRYETAEERLLKELYKLEQENKVGTNKNNK